MNLTSRTKQNSSVHTQSGNVLGSSYCFVDKMSILTSGRIRRIRIEIIANERTLVWNMAEDN